MLNQWGPVDMREFRASWKVAPQTANRDMSVIRSFFEFAFCNEWIDRNPGRLVKNPKGKSSTDGRFEQKLPFSGEELTRMYEVAEKRYGKMETKWLRTNHHQQASGVVNSYRYKWTGQDLADFTSVSVYTGLRISDVATFHIDRLNENGEVRLRTTKGRDEREHSGAGMAAKSDRASKPVPNHLRWLWSKAMVVSTEGKGLERTRSGGWQEEDRKGTTDDVSKA
jgi:site-specific recombinase XerC